MGINFSIFGRLYIYCDPFRRHELLSQLIAVILVCSLPPDDPFLAVSWPFSFF